MTMVFQCYKLKETNRQTNTISTAILQFTLHGSYGKNSNIHERHSQQTGNRSHTIG